MRRMLGSLLLWGGIAAAVVPLAAAVVLDRTGVTEAVVLTSPADEATVALNREQFDDTLEGAEKREAVASLYGQVARGLPAERLIFVDEADLVRPAEDLTLLLWRKQDGLHQVGTLYTIAVRTLVAGALAAVAGLLLRRRAPRPAVA